MADLLAKLRITNAALVAAGTQSQWIGRDGSLTVRGASPPPDNRYLWDFSGYGQISIAVAYSGLTGLSGGNLGYSCFHPDVLNRPDTGAPVEDGSAAGNLITTLASGATTKWLYMPFVGPYGTNTIANLPFRFGLVWASSTTPVTAGSDLYMYIYGFGPNPARYA